MKTKDIIEKAIKEAREKKPGVIIPRDDIYNAILQAGYDEGYLGGCAEIAKGAIADRDRHYKAGKRLVVDWLINDSYETTIHFGEDWQAKLKEWGIE